MTRTALPWICLIILSAQPLTAQRTLTVGQGGGYDYSTVQAAVNAAAEGDRIIVHPGIYKENIIFSGRNIILMSTNPTSPAVVAATILETPSTGTVVTFAGTEQTSCALAGFTIRNARRPARRWLPPRVPPAGIDGRYCRALIEHNVVTSNAAYGIYRCRGTIQSL